ncbi:MAG: AAA family ATPase, partial [Micromonosporaceae bacterium]
DFRNTVLIMTSNLGSELITSTAGALGFAGGGEERSRQTLRDRIMKQLRESFRPEFLNRIDEVIIFDRLDADELHKITEMLLEETQRRVRAQDIALVVTPVAVDWLVEHGYEPEFGARPMRRLIQREIDNRLSTLLLDGELQPGQRVTVDAVDGHLSANAG